MDRVKRSSLIIITTIFIISALIYIFSKLIGVQSLSVARMILKIRFPKLIVIITAGIIIGITSLVFQTIVNNRILTPGILGFDSIFIGVQTLIIFIFGNATIFMNPIINFIFSTLSMLLVTLTLYKLVLRKSKNNVIILLLIGIVITTIINSAVSFMQSIMSPDEFLSIAAATTVSLTNMNLNIILIAVPLLIICIILFWLEAKKYEVISLGKDVANNLGVNYVREVNKNLIYISIAMSIATALVGPLSFLGLITVNLSREFAKTNNYKVLIVYSALLSVIFLLLGIIFLEVIQHVTSLSVIINLVGGFYLIFLILKENKL